MFKREKRFQRFYISDIYHLREEKNNNIEGLVAELIMSSLCGRFGMKTYALRIEVISLNERFIVEALRNIIGVVNVDHVFF